MNKEKIHEIFRAFRSHTPNPSTELTYSSRFQLLIAVVLSAQTTDISVNKITKKLFNIADNACSILCLGQSNLEKIIKSIGLYRRKSFSIIQICKIVLEKHDGDIPKNFEELIKLPGVGRKTANVVLNTLFNKPLIGVDTHVFRTCNRTKIATGKMPRDIERILYDNVPKQYLFHAHNWLVLHGRHVCRSRKPLCYKCRIIHLCEYEKKNYS